MERTDIKVTVFRDGDFKIYVEEDNGIYTIFLGHSQYGPIEYLWSKEIGQEPYEELVSIIEAGLKEDELDYKFEHFDYEDLSDREKAIADLIHEVLDHDHADEDPSPVTS